MLPSVVEQEVNYDAQREAEKLSARLELLRRKNASKRQHLETLKNERSKMPQPALENQSAGDLQNRRDARRRVHVLKTCLDRHEQVKNMATASKAA